MRSVLLIIIIRICISSTSSCTKGIFLVWCWNNPPGWSTKEDQSTTGKVCALLTSRFSLSFCCSKQSSLNLKYRWAWCFSKRTLLAAHLIFCCDWRRGRWRRGRWPRPEDIIYRPFHFSNVIRRRSQMIPDKSVPESLSDCWELCHGF